MEKQKDQHIINGIGQIPDEVVISPEKQALFDLIDKAARGDVEAAGRIAEGYLLGSFETAPNYAKAQKWSRYAAKRGDSRGLFVQEELKKLGYTK